MAIFNGDFQWRRMRHQTGVMGPRGDQTMQNGYRSTPPPWCIGGRTYERTSSAFLERSIIERFL